MRSSGARRRRRSSGGTACGRRLAPRRRRRRTRRSRDRGRTPGRRRARRFPCTRGRSRRRPRATRARTRTEKEILRGVAGDSQLGQHDEVGPAPLRFADGRHDPLDVPLEVADDDVQLCEREPHPDILHGAPPARPRGFRLPITNFSLSADARDGDDLASIPGPAGLSERRLHGRPPRLASRRRGRGDAPSAPAARAPARGPARGPQAAPLDGELLVAEAAPGDPSLDPPAAPTPAEAQAAQAKASGPSARRSSPSASSAACARTGPASASIPAPSPDATGSSRRHGLRVR